MSSLSATKVVIMLPPMRKKLASVYDNSLFAVAAILTKTWPMMTLSNGNIFRITGLLCREFTGHRWIPRTKASDAELWSFLWSVPWINGWVNNRKAGDLRGQRSHYDLIVMRPQTLHNVPYWPYCILISHWPSKWFHPKLAGHKSCVTILLTDMSICNKSCGIQLIWHHYMDYNKGSR